MLEIKEGPTMTTTNAHGTDFKDLTTSPLVVIRYPQTHSQKTFVNQQEMGPNLSNSSPVALVFWDSFGLDGDRDRRVGSPLILRLMFSQSSSG